MDIAEWIYLQSYSGLVSYCSLDYPYICYVVPEELQYFMHRLPPD